MAFQAEARRLGAFNVTELQPPRLTRLSPQQCDDIFAPVFGSLVAIYMTETMMRTSIPDRSAEQQVRTDPDRVATASMMHVVENFRERYINSTYSRDPSFRFGGQAPAVRGRYATAATDRNDQFLKLQRSLILSMVANLGTTCFGYVFERYQKEAPRQGPDESERAFGLNDTRWASFQAAYPSARSTAWTPSGTNWLVRKIRNSFAHAGWRIGGNAISLYDATLEDTYNGRTNWNVTVSVSDLKNLIYDALYCFIKNIESAPGNPLGRPSLSHEIVIKFIEEHRATTAYGYMRS